MGLCACARPRPAAAGPSRALLYRQPTCRLVSTAAEGKGPAAPRGAPAEKPKSAFWQMFREYGTVFVSFWGASWLVCFVPIYGAFHFHLLPYDGMDILYALGAHYVFDLTKWSPQLVNAAVAFECNEFLDLLRLPLIIAATPRVARWLRAAR